MKTIQKHHQGFVLVTALIFLIVLSLLGVMMLRGSLFEERMASNDRDRTLAREYAEMALRDAERDVMGIRYDGKWCAESDSATPPATLCKKVRPTDTRPTSAAQAKNFWGASVPLDAAFNDGGLGQDVKFQGVYRADSAIECGKPIWEGADWKDDANPARKCAGSLAAAVPTVAYGTFTDAPFVGPDGTTAPRGIPAPRYLIEVFPGKAVTAGSSSKVFFRITAVGFGRTSGPTGRTSVTLQTVFSPS